MKQKVILCFEDSKDLDFCHLVETAVENTGQEIITVVQNSFILDAYIRTPLEKGIVIVYFSSSKMDDAELIDQRCTHATVVVFTSYLEVANPRRLTMLSKDGAGIVSLLEMIKC